MKSARFISAAEEEMNESAAYYQSQAAGLGLVYLKSVERAVYLIEESPARWPVINGRLRRCLVRRFPFAILYYDEPDEIVIVAVAHMSRRPGYWKDRK